MLIVDLKTKVRSRLSQDILILIVTIFSAFLFFIQFDTFEYIYTFSRKYEFVELDEIIPTLVFTGLALMVFFFRRWQDMRFLSLVLEEHAYRHSLTQYPNRRALNRLLFDKAQQIRLPLSLLMIDVHGLRTLLSSYGLSVYEEALKQCLEHLNSQLTNDCIIGHWSGEQFMVFGQAVDNATRKSLEDKIMQSALSFSEKVKCDVYFYCAGVTVHSIKALPQSLDELEERLHSIHYNAKLVG